MMWSVVVFEPAERGNQYASGMDPVVIATSIATGIVATVICGVAVWAWRRFRYPVEWTLTRITGDDWRIQRTARRRAFQVGLSAFTPRTDIAPVLHRGVTKPMSDDIGPKGEWDISGLVAAPRVAYQLYWISRDTWRIASFEVHDGDHQIAIRRRQVKEWTY